MKDGEQYNPDVNNSFLIVARAIERMSVMPTEEEVKLIESIAKIIANNQSKKYAERLPSRYPRVHHQPTLKLFIGRFEYEKKRYTVSAKTDYQCFKKLIKLEKKIKNL